jgi:hypothetical protein
MEDPIKGLKEVLLDVAIRAQEKFGNDKRAVVVVMNALSDALVEYCVRATGPERKDAQKRYDELAMPVAKAIQEFMAQHTGACVIIERKPEEKEGES